LCKLNAKTKFANMVASNDETMLQVA
jgi:hypothetical protein